MILTVTPYTAPNGGSTAPGNATGPVIRFPELFEDAKIGKDRWAYVQVDSRSFGGSGGCFEYYGANEVKDAGTAVEWAAGQDWSAGKVGMWGKSYDGATQVLALAADPKGLAATVIQSPGLSAYTALWMGGVHYATGRYLTTITYTGDGLTPPQNVGTLLSPEYALAYGNRLAQDPQCRADAMVGMNVHGDRRDPFWAGREPYLAAKGSKVPTLWSHGFFDANTKPVHLDVWESLAGPHHAWFGQYTHVRGHEEGVGRRGFLEESMRFLDQHVRGVGSAEADPAVTVQRGDGDGPWRAEDRWPPTDIRTWAVPLHTGSFTDGLGNDGDGSGAGQGSWTTTQPLPHAVHLAGETVVTADVDTPADGATVVALLYDVDAAGKATLMTRGAQKLTGSGPQQVGVKLYPQDWQLAAGHRLGVLLSGADDSWFQAGTSMAGVTVTGGSATLPVLTYRRETSLTGGPSDAITDASPFDVPAATLDASRVDAPVPSALSPRPAPAVVGSTPKATLKLRITGKGSKRVLRISGTATTATRVIARVRFGEATVARRTVKVRKGAYTLRVRIGRLKSGRLDVKLGAAGTTLTGRCSVRTRRCR